jgi:hypothetical protein
MRDLIETEQASAGRLDSGYKAGNLIAGLHFPVRRLFVNTRRRPSNTLIFLKTMKC